MVQKIYLLVYAHILSKEMRKPIQVEHNLIECSRLQTTAHKETIGEK